MTGIKPLCSYNLDPTRRSQRNTWEYHSYLSKQGNSYSTALQKLCRSRIDPWNPLNAKKATVCVREYADTHVYIHPASPRDASFPCEGIKNGFKPIFNQISHKKKKSDTPRYTTICIRGDNCERAKLRSSLRFQQSFKHYTASLETYTNAHSKRRKQPKRPAMLIKASDTSSRWINTKDAIARYPCLIVVGYDRTSNPEPLVNSKNWCTMLQEHDSLVKIIGGPSQTINVFTW